MERIEKHRESQFEKFSVQEGKRQGDPLRIKLMMVGQMFVKHHESLVEKTV